METRLKDREARLPPKRRRIETKVGRLEIIGFDKWNKAQVPCPQCGQPATAGNTGDVWCRACGFDTASLAGCG